MILLPKGSPVKERVNPARVNLPEAGEDIEYYIKVKTAARKKLVWPATAPELNQTVVVMP